MQNKIQEQDIPTISKKCEEELSEMIRNRKERYFYDLSVKLNNPQTSPKTNWSIIKSCYNGRKIPIIPPLSVNGKIITNFKEKANLFNKYFSSQCNPLPNNRYIYKIIKTLDISKASGNDEVSIRMLKLCGEGIVKPLSIIFNNCKLKQTFFKLWKKANDVLIHK